MRKIIKNKEPKKWTEYRLTPDVDYESIPELRESLLQEQGYICAYCMRRIPHKDKNSNENSRIDHILSRDKHPDMKLDYGNMVICCPGAISGNFHCDKFKVEEDITFSLFNDSFIPTLKYSTKTGKIKSSNPDWDAEMNNILNLNHEILKANRLEALNGVITSLVGKQWTTGEVRRKLEEWNNKDKQGRFKPYCGIVIWYLNKKLKSMQK